MGWNTEGWNARWLTKKNDSVKERKIQFDYLPSLKRSETNL